MKKLLIIFTALIMAVSCYSQEVIKRNIEVRKTAPELNLNGSGAVIKFYNGDVTLTQTSNALTLTGGVLRVNTDTVATMAYARLISIAPADTASMLTPYVARGDTASMLTPYVARGDTAAMLTPYIARGDTSLMLNPYILDIEARQAIKDSTDKLKMDATVGLAAADTNTYGGAATRTFVESLLGSGSGLSAQRLPFIVGVTTGAPTSSDSTIAHTAFEGKHIDLYRDGAKQYQNFTATNTVEGFRVNGSTITVNPLWQDGELILIDIIQPILWSYLSLEGEESSLLDSLRGYWKLDETSGTLVTDATGIQDGARTAAVGVGLPGRLGYANTFNVAADVINIPYNTNTVPRGTDFSVSVWVRLDTLPSDTGHENYIFQQNVGASPWSAHWIQVDDADDRIHIGSRNTAGTVYYVQSSAALVVDTWYHIVFVNPGNGEDLILYVNGSDVSASASTFSGTLLEGLSTTCFGNSYGGSNSNFEGSIDSPSIYGRALTAGEVATLYNAGTGITYPFN